MNYYELIYLKRELKNKLIGSLIEQAVSPFKNYIEFFVQANDEKLRLCFSSTPGNIALFSDNYRGAKKSNTIDFFEEVYGIDITDISLAETDRWVFLHFENGAKIHFRLFSNRANVFLSREGKIKEVFKEYDEPGDIPPEPQLLNLFTVEADISQKSTKNKLTAFNPMLPRQNLNELIAIHNLDEAGEKSIEKFVRAISDEMKMNPEFRLLENGETTMLGHKTLPLKTKKQFDSVNDLIRYRYKNYSKSQRLKQKKSALVRNLKRKIKRTNSGLHNLHQADKGLERAEKYEQWGHILMANAHMDVRNQKEIELDDLYDDAGKKVSIPIEPNKDLAENAQRYYGKATNAKQSYEEARQRIPKMEEELQKAEGLLESVQQITDLWEFMDWEEDHEKQLAEYRNQGDNSNEEHLPFHTLTVQGYPVWIGKNANSNDELVQKAHKEDVWMHARGVAGSHLIIRMGNQKEMPPKSVLLEAAAYAAYNSKAKGSGLVPVIITKKKYVRKPKGAPAGAVLVDKEEVEMVSPKKPKV